MSYQRLPTPTSTRLMKLHPGVGPEPLACQLEIVDLDRSDVEYQAVSYAWGDDPVMKPLQCSNHTLMIPASLHSVLRRVRDDEDDMTLWADAVCIDQGKDRASLQERAQQVQMMHEIFSKALLVIVDLGEEPAAFSDFLCLGDALTELGEDAIMDGQLLHRTDTPEIIRNVQVDSPVWEAFDDLMTRPWYHRVWVVQEFALAQGILMLVGEAAIQLGTFRDLCSALEWLRNLLVARSGEEREADFVLERHSHQARYFMLDCRQSHAEGHTVSLDQFIRAALKLKATDPRDRLYGGYGILDQAVRRDISVDYEVSVENLSLRLSILLFQRGYANLVLEQCAGITGGSLPTWCINLVGDGADRWEVEHSLINLSREHEVYTASGTTQIDVSPTTHLQTIAMSACVIGRVKTLTGPYPTIPAATKDAAHYLAVGDWFESMFSWLGMVLNLSRGPCSWDDLPNQPGWKCGPVDALWRTLMCDLIQSPPDPISYIEGSSEMRRTFSKRPSARFSAYFHGWLKMLRLVQENHLGMRNVDFSSHSFQQIEVDSNKWMPQMAAGTGKRLGATETSRLGLFPAATEEQDEICIFAGVKVPFVVRRKGPNRYQIVGSCYLHEMMDGQAVGRNSWRLEKIMIE